MSKYDATLKKYLAIFADQEMYFVNDTKTLEIFKMNPANTDADIVRMKVGAVNDRDLKLTVNTEDMVKHILQLKIDDRLKAGNLSLVNDIAAIENSPNPMLLHFASAYCNFHRPEIYPIYSNQHIEFYRRYITNYQLPLDPEKLNTYEVFYEALNDLVNRLGVSGKMNYLQLRKFGWLYAEKVVQESN